MEDTNINSVWGIAVTGKYGHGKNHFARILGKYADVEEISVGGALKKCCRVLLPGATFDTQQDKDCPIPALTDFYVDDAVCHLLQIKPHEGWKDQPTSWKFAKTANEAVNAFCEVLMEKRPKTRGELLQVVGTEIGRQRLDPDLWMSIVEREIQKMNELRVPWVATDARYENELEMFYRNRGVVLRMEAPELTPGTRDHTHPSETSLDHVPLPTFFNDRSDAQNLALEELCSGGVECAINRIRAMQPRASKFYKK